MNEEPHKSGWKRILGLIEKLIVSIIVAFLSPAIVALRLLVARSFESSEMPSEHIAAYSVIVLLICILLILLFKRLIYDPLVKHVALGGMRRLRAMASVIIFAQFMVLLLFFQLFLNHSAASANRKAINEDGLRARAVVDGLVDSLDFNLPEDERHLLQDAVFYIDKSSTLRKKIADTCHSIDAYDIRIEWCGVGSTVTHTFSGKTHNKDGCIDSGSTFKVIHWADMPCWQLEKCIEVRDLGNKGKSLKCDLKEHKIITEGKPELTFYVGTISGIGRNFHIEEVVEWPCALWRKPDAVVVDCARFMLGVETVNTRIVTDTGIALAKIYKAVLGADMKVQRIDKNIEIIDLSMQSKLSSRVKPSLFTVNVDITDPDSNAQYIFVIYKRDKEAA